MAEHSKTRKTRDIEKGTNFVENPERFCSGHIGTLLDTSEINDDESMKTEIMQTMIMMMVVAVVVMVMPLNCCNLASFPP